MEDQLISFETAKLAKEKGFNEVTELIYSMNPILGLPNNYLAINADKIKVNTKKDFIAAPTQSLLQKWLREEYNIYIEIRCVINRMFTFHIVSHRYYSTNNYLTWELALEAALIKALNFINKDVEVKSKQSIVPDVEEKIQRWIDTVKYQIDNIGNAYADVTVFEEDKDLFINILSQLKLKA